MRNGRPSTIMLPGPISSSARSGVTSALLVHAGWNAVNDILSGPDNFLNAYAPMANVAQVQRPESVLEANHLRVQMDDITEQMDGFVVPSDSHIEQVLNFVRGWDRNAPLVVHCYAGISRSTASAFAAACMLNPHRDEMSIARQIRAASPIASPNRLMVGLADKALRREGRMLRALDEMGPGNMMIEGRPFRIDLD